MLVFCIPAPGFSTCTRVLNMDSVRSKNSDEYSDQSHLSARFPNYKRWGMRGSEAPPGPVRSSSRRYRWRMLGRVLLHFVRWENAKNAGKDRGFVMRRIVAGRVQERVFDAAKFSKNLIIPPCSHLPMMGPCILPYLLRCMYSSLLSIL